MSEDDTFRILKRPPFAEIHQVYSDRFWDFYKDDELFQNWLDQIGYTKDELREVGNEYTRRRNIS